MFHSKTITKSKGVELKFLIKMMIVHDCLLLAVVLDLNRHIDTNISVKQNQICRKSNKI